MKENALTWVESYLADRTQCVPMADKTSPDLGLHFDVAQGSMLEPKNYCTYTKPVSNIIRRYNVNKSLLCRLYTSVYKFKSK